MRSAGAFGPVSPPTFGSLEKVTKLMTPMACLLLFLKNMKSSQLQGIFLEHKHRYFALCKKQLNVLAALIS